MRIPVLALFFAALIQGAAWLLGPPAGLRAEYFDGPDRSGPVAVTGVDARPSTDAIGLRWRGAAPQVFSARWFGYLTVPADGEYTFVLTSDDGATLSVNGQAIVSDPPPHAPHTQVGLITLEAGSYVIALNYEQRGGGMVLDLQWAPPGENVTAIPAWRYTPDKTAAWKITGAHYATLAAIALVLVGVIALIVRMLRSRSWVIDRPRFAALMLFSVLAVAHTWPMATAPSRLTRHDNRDTLLNEWIVSWVAHQSVTAPAHLFQGNIFYPEHDTLAYSEAMLVQSALGAPLLWSGASPVLVYNLLVMAGMALSGWALALVVHRWTGDWIAGIVAGAVAGFSAHTMTRLPHLQTQHVEFLPFALLALDDLLTRPTTRAAIRVALWSVLQAFTSVYLLVFTAFALASSVIARPRDWWGPRFVPFVRTLGIGALLAAALLAPFLLPYYRVSQEQGLVRSLGDAAQYAATFRDYLTTPARVHLWWSLPFHGTTGLFPGLLALVLAALAIGSGLAFTDRRARMALVFGAVGFALSFGPAMPGYETLYRLTPLLQPIRATARFGYLVTLAVAILAGFGVVTIRRACAVTAWRVVAPALIVVAALESMAAPLGLTRFDGIAPIYDRVPRGPEVVVVEVPFFASRSAQFHAHYMLNSTRHWRPIVNGYSGFQPPSFYEHAAALQGFPDDSSIALLRDLKVTHIFVHRAQMTQEQLTGVAARRELRLIDSFGETELYELAR